MKEMVRYGFTLALICALASASLALANSFTKSRIMAQEAEEEQASLKEVMPLSARFEEVKPGKDILYYKAYGKDGKFIGVAFKAQAKGYSSDIQAIVGMTKEGAITAIKILAQNETPGLGSRVSEPSFTSQFSHKNLNEVQAITGATISSKAVIDSVSKKVQEIKKLIEDEE